MKCYTKVLCLKGKDDQIKKADKSPLGEQRYRCCNTECSAVTFMLKYHYKTYEPDIKNKTIEMALNGSGV